MKIYLDTWVFQYWITGKLLTPHEIDFLYSLINNNEYEIVLSCIHLLEICARENREQALKIASFLDSFSNKIWLKNPVDLIIMALKRAYCIFKERPFQIEYPYVPGIIKTLYPNNDTLELSLLFGDNLSVRDFISMGWDPESHKATNKRHRKYITVWAPDNTRIANSLSKKDWNQKVLGKLKENLLVQIVKNELVPQEELKTNSFIDFLITNPNLILTFYFPFHLQHFLHRNSRKFKTSNIGDLSACAAIGYVDHMILDGKMYRPAMQAISSMEGLGKIGPEISSKLNGSVEELAKKLNFKL